MRIMVAAAGLALGACGGGEDGQAAGNGSGKDGAAGARAESTGSDVRLQPGEWEMKIEVKNAGMPGMEGMPGMKDMTTTARNCLTEEEAAKPDAGFFAGKQESSCKTEGFDAKGGKVSGTVTCTGEAGEGKMVMKTEGQFTPTSFESTTRSEMEAEGMKMTTEARVTGRRIGECPAKAQG